MLGGGARIGSSSPNILHASSRNIFYSDFIFIKSSCHTPPLNSHHYARRSFEIKAKYCSMLCLKLEEEMLVSILASPMNKGDLDNVAEGDT